MERGVALEDGMRRPCTLSRHKHNTLCSEGSGEIAKVTPLSKQDVGVEFAPCRGESGVEHPGAVAADVGSTVVVTPRERVSRVPFGEAWHAGRG